MYNQNTTFGDFIKTYQLFKNNPTKEDLLSKHTIDLKNVGVDLESSKICEIPLSKEDILSFIKFVSNVSEQSYLLPHFNTLKTHEKYMYLGEWVGNKTEDSIKIINTIRMVFNIEPSYS